MSKKRLLCIITFMAVIVTFVILLRKHIMIIVSLLFVVMAIFIVNHYAVRNIELQKEPFQINGKIRNVDYLIIGDMIDYTSIVPSDRSFVQIKAPNRSLKAAFEILKHTSSILDEDNGSVIIAVKKAKSEKYFSLFDVPFLYTLTIKKYGIEKLALFSKFPFFVKPFSTLILLLNFYSKNWKEIKCPNNDIICFCDERNFQLLYYEC